MGRFLINRAEPEASETEKRLHQAGHQAVLSPAYRVRTVSQIPPEFTDRDYDGVLLTSRNGVRAWAEMRTSQGRPLQPTPPLYAVGARTAALANELGLPTPVVSEGDGERLAQLVLSCFANAGGRFLHPTGPEPAPALSRVLKEAGHTVATVRAYEIEPIVEATEAARTSLVERTLDGVLFFSARSADLAAEQMRTSGLLEPFTALPSYCLSRQVASRVRRNSTRDAGLAGDPPPVRVASRPSLEALIALLG